MKTIIAGCCLLLGFSLSISAQKPLSGDSFATVKETGAGTIVLTYVETPAFVYRTPTNTLAGICVDICTIFKDYVEKTYKVKLTYQWEGDGANFRSFYSSVQAGSGGVFGLGNVTIRPDRLNEVKFTPPMIKNIALLVSHETAPDVKSLTEAEAALKNFTGYAPKGSTHETRMKELKQYYVPTLKIELVGSSFEALNKTLANPKSVCYQDVAIYWDYKQKGNPIKYHPLENQPSEELAMIMPMDSDWKPVWDEFFAKGFKSGKLYQMSLVKHLGSEVVQMVKMAQ